MGRPIATDPKMMPCRENEESMAQAFLRASADIGRAIQLVEEMARLGWPQVAQEGDAADMIVIQGEEVARACRTLAMRIDRAALLNMPDGGYRN